MALSILDGNQSATTLSTIVTSGQHIPAHTIVSLGTQAKTDIISAISSGISISGAVTANLSFTPSQLQWIKAVDSRGATYYLERVSEFIWRGGKNDLIQITYSANDGWIASGLLINTTFYSNNSDSRIPPKAVWVHLTENWTLTISYEQPSIQEVFGTLTIGNSVTIGSSITIGSIPNGALTTRFGSITTANTSFATTAVTNTSRKYLMIQNIASSVITVGIGFTPTTTQGIQLSAGALVTYDGNYIPTGAVRILSSVTASNFTVLEA
jgi:hypothetical protein